HRVDELDVGARDRQHADRLVLAVRDEREVALRVDGEPRRLLADVQRVDELGWVRLQIDDLARIIHRTT
ncbi:MAG TPA: hypothetical protein VN985_03710, partial [Candidatus Eisenbacteria bacterium]|nr:hypothetical protein [Candidatus Eisenbacteria bacterium]